tara:strand:+ start:112 stop:879 length:768 start_codon:yes stop_codon:yes gene_type:complete
VTDLPPLVFRNSTGKIVSSPRPTIVVLPKKLALCDCPPLVDQAAEFLSSIDETFEWTSRDTRENRDLIETRSSAEHNGCEITLNTYRYRVASPPYDLGNIELTIPGKRKTFIEIQNLAEFCIEYDSEDPSSIADDLKNFIGNLPQPAISFLHEEARGENFTALCEEMFISLCINAKRSIEIKSLKDRLPHFAPLVHVGENSAVKYISIDAATFDGRKDANGRPIWQKPDPSTLLRHLNIASKLADILDTEFGEAK